MDAWVFGYGSLVNAATHGYTSVQPARVTGWRRAWRHVQGRDVAFLTVVPNSTSEIDGVAAFVRSEHWDDLDQREIWYQRADVAVATRAHLGAQPVRIYHAPDGMHQAATMQKPILLSYLDVVVQGFLREFGEDGVADFFQTTDGWDAPIAHDRASPRYGRAQTLSVQETQLVDHHLAQLNCVFV